MLFRSGIYHHIYDLGTIGQFIAVGKERMAPVVDQKTGDIVARKIMTMMVVADERICDGLYYARSMRLFRRILENPWMLEERLEEVENDIDYVILLKLNRIFRQKCLFLTDFLFHKSFSEKYCIFLPERV